MSKITSPESRMVAISKQQNTLSLEFAALAISHFEQYNKIIQFCHQQYFDLNKKRKRTLLEESYYKALTELLYE